MLERQGHLRFIRNRRELDAHWDRVRSGADDVPLGIVLSMEGTDPVVEPGQMREWWDAGLRAAGLAHYGQGQYAFGTGVDGPLSPKGFELLREMERLGMALDVTHLSDTSMAQALDAFGGRVLASHHNCRALVPGDRQLTDEQIRRLVARDAVIGTALDAWMLYPAGCAARRGRRWSAWRRWRTTSTTSARSRERSPRGDRQRPRRRVRDGADAEGSGYDRGFAESWGDPGAAGYSAADVEAVFHGNWLRFLREALPA